MNTSPPVLPCLQELNKHNLTKDETNVVVDNWNCWFHRDLSILSSVWPEFGRNEQSVGELWLGFLRYYTENFDWNNNVVSIRSNGELTRKAKNWNKHKMAIEDPFELSHNLAAGVSHKS
jgi:terminal uridylyltransferase